MIDEVKPQENNQLEQIEQLKQKADEYLNGWKRERADFINYKKSEMERIGDLVKYANEELILKILPILDNIYLAENHIPEELQTHEWTKGFSQIKNQLQDFLTKEGIEPMETIGKPFDPATMESVGEIEAGGVSDTPPTDTVVEDVQRGYTMHGKLIRVARVKISK